MRATRDAWKITPLSAERAQLSLHLTLSAEQLDVLERGFVPRDMDDKWFLFMEDDWLYFHRSWTGHCIFQVRLQHAGGVHSVAEAWVTRAGTHYRSPGDDHDRDLLERLITAFAKSRL